MKKSSTDERRMGSLEWVHLYEAFVAFQTRAQKRGLYADELERIEDDLLDRCPIPQPKEMKV